MSLTRSDGMDDFQERTALLTCESFRMKEASPDEPWKPTSVVTTLKSPSSSSSSCCCCWPFWRRRRRRKETNRFWLVGRFEAVGSGWHELHLQERLHEWVVVPRRDDDEEVLLKVDVLSGEDVLCSTILVLDDLSGPSRFQVAASTGLQKHVMTMRLSYVRSRTVNLAGFSPAEGHARRQEDEAVRLSLLSRSSFFSRVFQRRTVVLRKEEEAASASVEQELLFWDFSAASGGENVVRVEPVAPRGKAASAALDIPVGHLQEGKVLAVVLKDGERQSSCLQVQATLREEEEEQEDGKKAP